MAALFAEFSCALLILGVLWELVHIVGEVASDGCFRRRATWQFGLRWLLLAVVAASMIFGLIRLGMNVFVPVFLALLGVATMGGIVRLFYFALSPRSEPNSASVLREPSQPIGPPLADGSPAAHRFRKIDPCAASENRGTNGG